MMLAKVILFIYLVIMGVLDMRKGYISLRVSGSVAGFLFLLRLWELYGGEMLWKHAFSGILIGMLMFVVAYVSRGGVGRGDAIVFAITGLVYDFWYNFMLLFLSLTFCGITGGILLVVRRVKRKTLLPFVPFIMLAYGVMFVWELWAKI